MTTYLDTYAVESALKWLDERWVDSPIPPWQGEAYREVLGQLRINELRPAVCCLPPEARPTPEALLEMVHELRETFHMPAPIPTSEREPDRGHRSKAKEEVVRPIIEKARRDLGKETP